MGEDFFYYLTLLFHEINKTIYSYRGTTSIAPRLEQLIKNKTSIQNDKIIIPYQKFHFTKIPESSSSFKNWQIVISIISNSTCSVTIDFRNHTIKLEYINLREKKFKI